MMRALWLLAAQLLLWQLPIKTDASGCPLTGDDRRYVMGTFSVEKGVETNLIISENTIKHGSRPETTCYKVLSRNVQAPNIRSKWNLVALYRNPLNRYQCYVLYWQSLNVLQYHMADFNTPDEEGCKRYAQDNLNSDVVIAFSTSAQPYNCKTIFEGVYWFTYQIQEIARTPCNAMANKIKACQRAGTQERDNSIVTFTWGLCPGQAEMRDRGTQTYRCYGMWTRGNSLYAAIAMDEGDQKFKYRCLVTRKDQNERSIQYRWGMTVDADCMRLRTPDASPIRLVLQPVIDAEDQMPLLQPGCNLPKNFTGVWFYPAAYQTDVYINATTIKMRRQLDQWQWEEVYFVCKQAQESRYLMAVVTQGKCDVDYICMHFMPRHHNIIRFRLSKPLKHDPLSVNTEGASYMSNRFREACHWSSFTLDQVEWTYEYFVLNPPVPINCPLQGRFKFNMIGQQAEQYYTKIPGGVTVRPRVQVVCPPMFKETDLYACVGDDKRLKVDVERCMRLDHIGRPLSEYDVPDNILTCVGFWMEDAKSYLITYDPDDPVVGNFRCWVYKRTGLRTYRLSRSMASKCLPDQTSSSAYPNQSASLLLELTENERLFDYCPMQFDYGKDPYKNVFQLEVFASAPPTVRGYAALTATAAGLVAFITVRL